MRSRAPRTDRTEAISIRLARARDADALGTLAILAESQPLDGDPLVAEADGELWAAIQLRDGRTIADPFRPTWSLRQLLVTRRSNLARRHPD
jgi:hypothetical protein